MYDIVKIIKFIKPFNVYLLTSIKDILTKSN